MCNCRHTDKWCGTINAIEIRTIQRNADTTIPSLRMRSCGWRDEWQGPLIGKGRMTIGQSARWITSTSSSKWRSFSDPSRGYAYIIILSDRHNHRNDCWLFVLRIYVALGFSDISATSRIWTNLWNRSGDTRIEPRPLAHQVKSLTTTPPLLTEMNAYTSKFRSTEWAGPILGLLSLYFSFSHQSNSGDSRGPTWSASSDHLYFSILIKSVLIQTSFFCLNSIYTIFDLFLEIQSRKQHVELPNEAYCLVELYDLLFFFVIYYLFGKKIIDKLYNERLLTSDF